MDQFKNVHVMIAIVIILGTLTSSAESHGADLNPN